MWIHNVAFRAWSVGISVDTTSSGHYLSIGNLRRCKPRLHHIQHLLSRTRRLNSELGVVSMNQKVVYKYQTPLGAIHGQKPTYWRPISTALTNLKSHMIITIQQIYPTSHQIQQYPYMINSISRRKSHSASINIPDLLHHIHMPLPLSSTISSTAIPGP